MKMYTAKRYVETFGIIFGTDSFQETIELMDQLYQTNQLHSSYKTAYLIMIGESMPQDKPVFQ